MGDAGLVVHLNLEPGEQLVGSAGTDTTDHDLAFSGWLGLAEVITVLRERAGQGGTAAGGAGRTR